jgi:GT2 family glycosyltransferase
MKVVACIVTYNRLELLKRCINALENQTYKVSKIIIINNDSNDGTSEWLEKKDNIIHHKQSNYGGAYGFKTAIELSLSDDADAIWLMDDDGYPANDALEKMLNYSDLMPAVLNSAVINEKNNKELVWKVNNTDQLDNLKSKLIPGIAHLFNGTLIHADVVKNIGLPNDSLVIWGDESEYFERIIKKYSVYTISDSFHFHPKAGFSVFKDLAFNFKLIYYFRNRYFVYLVKYENKFAAFFNYTIFILELFMIILIFNTQKIKKIKLLWLAYRSALRNEYISLTRAKDILSEI